MDRLLIIAALGIMLHNAQEDFRAATDPQTKQRIYSRVRECRADLRALGAVA